MRSPVQVRVGASSTNLSFDLFFLFSPTFLEVQWTLVASIFAARLDWVGALPFSGQLPTQSPKTLEGLVVGEDMYSGGVSQLIDMGASSDLLPTLC
jgi:hypothetical protein